jgi:hypothetical protein
MWWADHFTASSKVLAAGSIWKISAPDEKGGVQAVMAWKL